LAEEFLEDGQDAAAFDHPLFEAFEAFAVEVALGGVGELVGGIDEVSNFGSTAFEVGADLFADESADHGFQFEGGFVVGAAFGVAVGGSFADGAEFFECAEALGGGAFADAEAGDEVVKGKGAGGDEEETVDFADGLGEAEDADAVDEEFHDLSFDGREG
jgi:hypothetical protein